jgi:DNA-binding PadR family transcriptional regulator
VHTRETDDEVANEMLKGRERWILALLAEEARHGYALMNALAEDENGGLSIGPATLYRTLDGLADAGLIEPVSTERGAVTARRPWRITDLGRDALRTEAERLASFADRVRGSLGLAR